MANNGTVTHELNYVTTNRFYVEIDSAIAASFTECTGLSVQIKKNVFLKVVSMTNSVFI